MLLVWQLAVTPAGSKERKIEWGQEGVVGCGRGAMRVGLSQGRTECWGWEEGGE